MKKTTRLLSMLLASAMLLSFAACGSSSKEEEKTTTTTQTVEKEDGTTEEVEVEKMPLKISHHPYLHALPSVYAEQNGLYDMFDYTITQFSGGPTQNEAISSGAWEVGTTGIGGVLLGIIGYDMKVIGFSVPDSNTIDLWVRPDHPLATAEVQENGIIGTAEDYKGLDILCQSGTSCHMMTIGTLDYLGLSTDDVNLVDTAVASCFPAFLAGEGDAVALWSPFGFQAEAEGWVKVSSTLYLDIILPCPIVATAETVENRPEAVQAWLNAYLEAGAALAADPEMAASMLYDFEQSEGITMSEETSVLEVNARPLPTLEENKEYFKVREDGTTWAEEIILVFADFYISQGLITEEDKQYMIDSDFICPEFMENVAY